jgi:O-antigen/teichoic acid export membrane protein
VCQVIYKIKNKINKGGDFHELISGGAISFLMQGIGMLFGYILMALIANYYGAKILGVYSLSYTTLVLVGVLSALGLDMVILKIAGKHEGKSSIPALKKVYLTIMPSTLIFAFILIGVGYLNLFFDENEYKKYLIITGGTLFFSVILSVNIEYIRARGNIFVSELLRNIFRPIVSIILITITCLFYSDVYTPGYTLLIGSFLACIFSIYWIFGHQNIQRINASELSCNETTKSLLNSGFPIQISMLAFYMISNMVIYFIQGYENSVSVGLMLVSIKLAGLVNMPLMVLNKVCAQKFSKLYWSNQYKELQEYLSQVTQLAFYASLIAGMLLVIFSEYVLSIFGNDFIHAKNILFILVVGQLISCASGSVGIFMMMTGSEKAYRNIALAVALFSCVAYGMVLPIYGLVGSAYVLASSQAALNIISVVYIKYRLGFTTIYVPFRKKSFK